MSLRLFVPRRRPGLLQSLVPALALTLFSATASAGPPETGWPRVIEASRGHSIVVYEPRVTSFKGRVLTANAATSIQPPGDEEPTFGVIWFTADLEADSDGKSVKIERLEVTNAKFPENTPQLEEAVGAILERELPKSNQPWPLDRVYAGLEAEKDESATAAKIRNDAPAILISTTPTVLLVFQGEPQTRPVPDSELSRVVNTGHFVVLDGGGKNYYLSHGPYWYQAKDPMGPWEVIGNPPSNVQALKPEDEGVTERDQAPRMDSPPAIVASSRPAELIVFDGKPRFAPVGDTDLLHVTNSDKDVLKDVASQRYFVLLSGRWFSSGTLNGPWTFVPSDKLPEDFASIPRGSEIGRVRASVAGTPEAEDAVLSARVPKIEAVDRDEEVTLKVTYDGDPEFRRIKGTSIAYAVNTSTAVFRSEDRYYACEDGVWYVASEPDGPWTVSDRRPKDLEKLPAENPHYHTKYVTIYDSDPDVVYVGYTPGYFGCYPYWGSVVYGTGWYYSPWIGAAYYPYPATWGFGISYWGGWGFGFYGSWGFGYGGYYGYPYYGYGYGYGYGYPAYCGGYYGPGGYWPSYQQPYATSRTRSTVTERVRSGYPSTKNTASRTSAGETIGKSTASRSGDRVTSREGTTSRSLTSRSLTNRSGGSRVRSAEGTLTRRSSATRERSTLSERGTRAMRGYTSRERATRSGEGYRRGTTGYRSRGDAYERPRVNGRGWGDGRVLRGDGRSGGNGGRSGWSGNRSGSGGGRAGMGGARSGGGSRSGMGGARSGGGGGRSGGSYGGSRRR
jgi:hypothetical protein